MNNFFLVIYYYYYFYQHNLININIYLILFMLNLLKGMVSCDGTKTHLDFSSQRSLQYQHYKNNYGRSLVDDLYQPVYN